VREEVVDEGEKVSFEIYFVEPESLVGDFYKLICGGVWRAAFTQFSDKEQFLAAF